MVLRCLRSVTDRPVWPPERLRRTVTLKQDDVHFVCNYGTETTNGYMLTEHDAKALEAEARYMLNKAERLRGVLVPVAGDTAKTVFHSTRKQQKWLLPPQH